MKSLNNKIYIKQIIIFLAGFCILTAACTYGVFLTHKNNTPRSSEIERSEFNDYTIDVPDKTYIMVSEDEESSSWDDSTSEIVSKEEKYTSSETPYTDSDRSGMLTETSSNGGTDSDLFEFINIDMLQYYKENPTPPVELITVAEKSESNPLTPIEFTESSDIESYEESDSDTSKFYGTDTASSSEIILLDVPYYSQQNDMPTGCELISAKMVLSYLGHTVSNQDILDNLARSDLGTDNLGRLYGKNPFEYFIGDPQRYTGFGCYPPVIENMVNSMGFYDITVYNTSSQPLGSVAESYLAQGFPVMTWVTIGLND